MRCVCSHSTNCLDRQRECIVDYGIITAHREFVVVKTQVERNRPIKEVEAEYYHIAAELNSKYTTRRYVRDVGDPRTSLRLDRLKHECDGYLCSEVSLHYMKAIDQREICTIIHVIISRIAN
ncbi:hypothetical protein Plhal304r1_c007g0029451 [Plasmopara halstedii]